MNMPVESWKEENHNEYFHFFGPDQLTRLINCQSHICMQQMTQTTTICLSTKYKMTAASYERVKRITDGRIYHYYHSQH